MDNESQPEGIESAARPVVRVLLQARFPEAGAADDTYDMSPPMAVVYLSRDDLRGDKGIDGVQPAAWRQLVRLGGEPVGLSDVVVDPSEGPQFTQLNYGPFVKSVADVVARPERSVDTFNGQVRMLEIPALYTVALWYDGPKENLVIPLDPAPEPLDAGREYPVDDFLEIVRRMARDATPGPALV